MRLNNCDIYQLKKIVQQKKLICFGMGQVLREFLEDFYFMKFEKDIYAVVDNRVKENGEYITLNKCVLPLICPDKLMNVGDFIILISCADIAGVFYQLNQIEKLKDVDCFAVYYVRSQTNRTDEISRHYPATFRRTDIQRIPKIINYCWFGKGSIPERNLRWMESWKHYCPGYEIIRWDENNYDITKNTYMQEAYQEEKWAFVSDYARIDIIYSYGGIYIDTDVELIKSFDNLLYQSAFCGIESNRKIELGLGFGAEKGHPILKGLLELYENKHFLNKDGVADLTANGIIQNPYYKSKGFTGNGDYQVIDEMTVYPQSVLSPKDLYTGEMSITEHTYSIHHYDASWMDKESGEKQKSVKELYKRYFKGEEAVLYGCHKV